MTVALRGILHRSGLPYAPYTEARRQSQGERAQQASSAQAGH